MKEVFENYLQDIDVPKAERDAIGAQIDFFESLFEGDSENVTDIFVCDVLNEEKVRKYKSLWLFSSSIVSEARVIPVVGRIDFAAYEVGFNHLDVMPTDYDFKSSSNESKLEIVFSFNGGPLKGELTATGKNCDYAFKILKGKIIPNLVKISAATT